MEEHFRKSLGDDYKKVFKGAEKAPEQMEVDPVKAFKEDLDMSGYTVEDHFAKALGDTWVKLQAEAEKKERDAAVLDFDPDAEEAADEEAAEEKTEKSEANSETEKGESKSEDDK